jgi:hypothetical protein
MARNPKRYPDEAQLERLIPIKGWVYNLFIDLGLEQGRETKYQLAHELEQLARKYRKDREKKEIEPGPVVPAQLAA